MEGRDEVGVGIDVVTQEEMFEYLEGFILEGFRFQLELVRRHNELYGDFSDKLEEMDVSVMDLATDQEIDEFVDGVLDKFRGEYELSEDEVDAVNSVGWVLKRVIKTVGR